MFLKQRLWEGRSIWHPSLFWLSLSVFLNFFSFLKVVKTLLQSFSFAISANGNAKNIFVILSHSLLSKFTNYDDFCCWEIQKSEKGLLCDLEHYSGSFSLTLINTNDLLRFDSIYPGVKDCSCSTLIYLQMLFITKACDRHKQNWKMSNISNIWANFYKSTNSIL